MPGASASATRCRFCLSILFALPDLPSIVLIEWHLVSTIYRVQETWEAEFVATELSRLTSKEVGELVDACSPLPLLTPLLSERFRSDSDDSADYCSGPLSLLWTPCGRTSHSSWLPQSGPPLWPVSGTSQPPASVQMAPTQANRLATTLRR